MPGSGSQAQRLICLTPTRNEAWIIRQFLAAARCWADDVIVADQGSTDGTVEQLRATPGVTTLVNDSPRFDEVTRQRLLISRAREIPGRRILIALDADEALSANFPTSVQWQRLESAAPGTVLRFRWANLLPGFQQAWIPAQLKRFGFVDDGSEHGGHRIHNQRIPGTPDAPTIDMQDVVILHFQYVLWDRMRSKHRWYQAWEHQEHRQKGPLDIFRQYHHMYGSWDKHELQPVRREWFLGYERAGIDFGSLVGEPITWWDKRMVEMIASQGPAFFRKCAIWDVDWGRIASQLDVQHGDVSDPRNAIERLVHWLLFRTQPHRSNGFVRGFEHILRRFGW